MDLYGSLFRSVVYPMWETGVRGRRTLSYLRLLERTQWRSSEELQAIQTMALRRLLRHAQDHVPLYRERFAAAGVSAEDIREPADLVRLPILARDDARERAS